MTTSTSTTSTVQPSTPNILAGNGEYEVVVLDKENRVQRCIFRSPHYAAALGYISRNHKRRPWLDMVRNGRFVNWELAPQLLAEAELVG